MRTGDCCFSIPKKPGRIQQHIQGEQLYMAVYFWYIVTIAYTSNTSYKVPAKTQPCLIGHPVYVLTNKGSQCYLVAANAKSPKVSTV